MKSDPVSRKSLARTPSEVAAEYRKFGARLLARLAETGLHAERRGEQIVLVRAGSSVSLACGIPTGVLAELLHSGAVQCQSRAGCSHFTITAEGRARLLREKSGPDAFSDQHRRIEEREIVDEGSRHKVRVNTKEDPLDVFRRGRHIGHMVGQAEIDAGERLSRDLLLAQAVPQVTANWSRLVVDGAGYNPGLSVSETIMEARRRVDAAMRAVGPDFSGILIDTLGFSKGLEMLEREHGLPLRSGKVVPGLALRGLARHYGLSNAAVGKSGTGPGGGGIRHWAAADNRPKLRAG